MTDKTQDLIEELAAGKDADLTGFTLTDLIRAEHYCRQEADKYKDIAASWGKLYDFLSIHVVPQRMEDEDMESTKIAGIGRVNLRPDMWTQTLDATMLAEWLKENDMGDLLKEQVNGSTLKAYIKEQLKKRDGLVPPDTLVKITPYTRAVITKA